MHEPFLSLSKTHWLFKMLQVTLSSHILLYYLLINNAQAFIPLNLRSYITITVCSHLLQCEKNHPFIHIPPF